MITTSISYKHILLLQYGRYENPDQKSTLQVSKISHVINIYRYLYPLYSAYTPLTLQQLCQACGRDGWATRSIHCRTTN